MNRTLTLIASFRAKPGKEDRLRTALEAMIEPSLEEPGCYHYQPYVDPNRPSSMVIIEEWQDEDALLAHFATEHFRHVADVLEDVLAEPFLVRRYAAVEPII